MQDHGHRWAKAVLVCGIRREELLVDASPVIEGAVALAFGGGMVGIHLVERDGANLRRGDEGARLPEPVHDDGEISGARQLLAGRLVVP